MPRKASSTPRAKSPRVRKPKAAAGDAAPPPEEAAAPPPPPPPPPAPEPEDAEPIPAADWPVDGPRLRPLPRNLLLRPPPRRLPPIERDVDLRADPGALPGEVRGGRGRGGRGGGRRGRDRGRGDRGGRGPASPPPPAAPPPAPAAPPSAGPPPSATPAGAVPPPSPGLPPAPPHHPPHAPHHGHGGEHRRDGDRGGRRGRRRGRGRGGRDRDRDRHHGDGDRGGHGGTPVLLPPAASAAAPASAPTVIAPPTAGAPSAPLLPQIPPRTSPSVAPAPSAAPSPPPIRGADLARWRESTYLEATRKSPERPGLSAKPPLAVPTPELISSFADRVGFPGEFPFTRGVQATMYRGRPWTMRQYAGFASAAETNRRFRYLLERGQTGLSIAFDLPTQIGYDSDDPRAEGEVGKVGVPVNSLADMETVLDGIPLDRVTVSMTINATAPILVAMVAAVAKRRGVPLEKVGGTVQNDLLKEFVARNTWRFPVEASLRLSTDLIRFCTEQMPSWNPISVSGYHMREAGCTAAQEIAFTLGHGLAYLDRCAKAGMAVDRVAPRISFFFAAQMDLLEEVAKFRAARRLWARLVRERFRGNDASCRLRFHTQTAGAALTSAQPDVNVVRVTLQALAAVLGGTQSLHTNSRDEALGLPTEASVLLALRTQQVIAEESGVADVVDPLGGAPFVEAETDRLEAEARALLAEMDREGGPVEAARKGWTSARIAEAAYRHQRAVESGSVAVVGVNRHRLEGEAAPEVLKVDEGARDRLVEDLARRRSSRDSRKVDEALFGLEMEAGWSAGPAGLMPAILKAVEAEATVGEICRSLEKAFGAFDPARP